MKKTSAPKKDKRPSGLGYLLLAVLCAAAGICFFAFGEEALETLAILIGGIVTLTGVLFLIITLAHRSRGIAFGLKIALAACIIACGVCTMILRKPAIEILMNLFALLIIVDGSFKLNTAVLMCREHRRTFVLTAAISTATIACGFLAITYVKHHFMLGAGMTVAALANLFSCFFVPKLLKKQVKEAAAHEEAEKKEETAQE